MSRSLTVILCAAVSSACSEIHARSDLAPEVETCVAAHPVRGAQDYASDSPLCEVDESTEEETEGTCAGPTPREVAEECASAGHPCDASAFVSRDAAACVARSLGFAEGLSPWRLMLRYEPRAAVPVWYVDNTTEQLGACDQKGDELALHAETGELVGEFQWSASCR
jgi:hypothetical protein